MLIYMQQNDKGNVLKEMEDEEANRDEMKFKNTNTKR